MPAKPRSAVIDPSITGTYHAMARCVRRSFLFGRDTVAGRDLSHRKEWIHRRVRLLARYFAIEVLFFGFLSNHYHIVLRNLPNLVEGWDDEEVIRRSCKIFPWKFQRLGVKERGRPTAEQIEKLVADRQLVQEMRKRLADPSWFMRQLNQYIATRANREDDCDGHFFEQRFKAEPIHDIFGLLICGLYVDLNEIAAGIAETPEQSYETSVYARLLGRNLRKKGNPRALQADGFLTPIFLREEPDGYPPAGKRGSHRASEQGLLDLSLDAYVDILRMLAENYRQASEAGGEKPPLDQDAIVGVLTSQGAMPRLTSDLPS